MEHIILSHIAKHLSTHNINQQHGFRQYFSCETQLIKAINDLSKSINQHTQTDVILLDFSKAFDSVPHRRLLSKLDYYVAPCKRIHGGPGFRIPYHSGFRIPNHCGFRIPNHCGFWIPVLWIPIPTAKISWIPDSGFSYMGRTMALEGDVKVG